MSRAKKGAASEGQVPAQKRSRRESVLHRTTVLLKAMEKIQESMKSMDKKFQGLEEGQKTLSGRIEALESNQRSHVENTGPHEEKPGERDATEVEGLTPSEQQSRLAAPPSYEPSRFF